MRTSLSLLLSLLLVACDSSSVETGAAGSYSAERFRVSFGDQTADFLSAGGRLDMRLNEDGRFEADLSTPDVPEIDGDESFEATFDGTYTVRGGDRIVFFHSEDLFVRDLMWSFDGDVIRSTDTAGGTAFDISLRRR